MQIFIKSSILAVVILSVVSPALAVHHPTMTVTVSGLGSTPRQATPVAVAVDVKPRTCPNPLRVAKPSKPLAGFLRFLNLDLEFISLEKLNRLPVAILGSETFDVTTVDIGLVELEGVAPIYGCFWDVATPVGRDIEPCACTAAGPDGYLDLILKFKAQAIVDALGEIEDGDVIPLILTGALLEEHGGAPVTGSDCVVIQVKGRKCKMR